MDIVIFGCTELGQHILRGLRKQNITPLCFAVDKPIVKKVDGLGVLSTEKAVKAFPSALYVIAVIHNTEVIQRLIGLGMTTITFYKFARFYAPYLLPYCAFDFKVYLPAERQVLFADDESRREYIGQHNWRGTLDPYYLLPYHDMSEIYFPPDLFELGQDEVFIDVGAYDGDTIQEFKKRAGGRIIAIEADPANYKKLVRNYPDITAYWLAAGVKPGRVSFNATSNHYSAVGEGNIEVECDKLDNLLKDVIPTYIKMDIEGAELDALKGAANIIKKHKPILAICVYHRPYDIWQIPVYIHWLVQDYKLYLRRYAPDCWEEVLYAVPPGRCKK